MKIDSLLSEKKGIAVSSFQLGDNKGESEDTKKEIDAVGTVEEVSLSISKEGVRRLQEQENLEQLAELQDQLEASKDSTAAFKDLTKMLEIARRISDGDKVPLKDERKLMEYNYKLYLAAKSAAALNEKENPKEYDTMFSEEKENGIDEENEEQKIACDETENDIILESGCE